LAHAENVVELRTRKIFAALDESLTVHGWDVARIGYVAYSWARNSLIEFGKVLILADKAFGTAFGGILLSSVAPDIHTTQLIVQFMLENAQIVASFAEPFPELRNWLGFLIDHIDRETLSTEHSDALHRASRKDRPQG